MPRPAVPAQGLFNERFRLGMLVVAFLVLLLPTVLDLARQFEMRYVLIDTFIKDGRALMR